MDFFEIENIAFEVSGYPVSYIELIGTLFGLISVYLASKTNILTWPTGIVNEFFFFILFFEVQLYADMLLQVYFFAVTLFGWKNWKAKKSKKEISKTRLGKKVALIFTILIGTIVFGYLFSNIHSYLPAYFPAKADFPFADSFIMVTSIFATILLAKKKLETWYLWIIVDIICIVLFLKKGILFLSFEYLIFLVLASYGLYNWNNKMKNG